MKRYLIAAALLAAPHLLPAQEPQTSQTPTFGAQVELVTVDVVVADKKQGTAVTGLRREDFAVFEDDRPQEVVSFEAVSIPGAKAAAEPSAPGEPAPPPAKPRVSTNTAPELRTGRSFVIVFDDIHLTGPQARQAKIAVSEFLKSGVREGDRVTLISSGGDAWWTARMEAGREEMLSLLKRLTGRLIPERGNDRISEYEAMRIHVYADPQVTERVQRRFQTYGVMPGSSSGRDMGMGGDPMVRGRASEVYFQAVSRNRLTLEVLERVLDSLAPVRGRKSLILVSQGFIYDPNLDDFKRVVQASRRSNCAIYFLDTRGLTGFPDYFSAEFGPAIDDRDVGFAFFDQQQEAEGAESLASDSGGFSVRNTNDLGKGIQRIADETSSYYLLGYHPSNAARDGRFRKIRVEVKRKGVTLRARRGYFAPLEAGAGLEKKKKTATGADPDFQTALDSPFEREEIPLRMGAFVMEETLLGKAKVVVAAEADVREFAFEQKDGRFVDSLEFLMVAAHRETGEYFRYDQQVAMKLLPETRERLAKTWFPILRDFDLAPGGYQAKIVVRDKNSGRVGTVVHEFEVPELAPLRVSTPVLSDTLQPKPENDANSLPRPALTVRRSFPAGGMLYCQYEVYGAVADKATGMPRVSAGYVVRRLADGTELTRMAPTPIKPTSLGKLSRMIGTSLEAAAPGEYELVLQLQDELGGKSLESREPFTVESGG